MGIQDLDSEHAVKKLIIRYHTYQCMLSLFMVHTTNITESNNYKYFLIIYSDIRFGQCIFKLCVF